MRRKHILHTKISKMLFLKTKLKYCIALISVPEFLLLFINALEKSHGKVFLYMITVTKLQYYMRENIERFWNIHNVGMVGEDDTN